jgi:hypothetical protein
MFVWIAKTIMNLFYKNLETHLKKKLHIIFSQLIRTLLETE